MRAWIVACLLGMGACSHSSAPAVVHAGNLVELAGAPSTVEVTAVAHLTAGETAQTSFSVASFPWNGKTATVAPLLPLTGVKSWTLTFGSGPTARVVSLVDFPQAGAPGTVALQFLDQLAQIDAVLKPPSDSAQAAAYQQALADLHTAVADARTAVTQAQSGSVTVGATSSGPIQLDAHSLAVLDATVAGAQEPVVALQSNAQAASVQALSANGALAGLFAVGTAAAICVVTCEAAALTITAGATFFAAMAGAVVVGSIVAQQGLDAVGNSDASGNSSALSVRGALSWGTVQSQLAKWLGLTASGSLGSDAAAAARDKPAPPTSGQCAPGVFLHCSTFSYGCFPAGTTCCSAGMYPTACGAGMSCTSCDDGVGIMVAACLPQGQACPTTTPSPCVRDLECAVGVCQVSTNTCVGCLTDGDCVDPHQICGAGNRCVPGCNVANNKPCASPSVCNSATSACVGCLVDTDCADAHQICTGNTCVAGCDATKKCAGGAPCSAATNTCACLSDSDCTDPHQICGPGNSCVNGCHGNQNCVSPSVCNTATSTCVACIDNSTCAAPTVCNTTSNTCVACLINPDCPSGQVCSNNVCVGCATDADCSNQSQICNSSNVCVDGCDANRSCAKPMVCDFLAHNCVQCLSTGDCPSGQICNTSTDTCAGGTATFDGSYSGGYSGTCPTSPVTPGSVTLSVVSDIITVTAPAAGSGSIQPNGSASMDAGGGGQNYTFNGTFVLSNGVASGSGGWVSPTPYGSCTGTWNVTR